MNIGGLITFVDREEKMNQAGRPKNLKDRELLSIDECLLRMQQELNASEPPFARRTLLNKLCAGELERFGTYHKPRVDWAEAKKLLNWRRKTNKVG